jgi:tetratricopeptide (TPR) repeat protein
VKSPARKTLAGKSPRKSAFSDAVKLYESGFKLMHAEKFDKARDTFTNLVKEFPDETELLDRAHVLIHVCQKRLRESKTGPKLKSADDYYEIGVAEMNRRELDDALEHLQQALKMSPRADHVLYALAAVSALRDERDEALEFLQRSIKFREENRFLAINDVDFESLSDDPEFIQLISPDEG